MFSRLTGRRKRELLNSDLMPPLGVCSKKLSAAKKKRSAGERRTRAALPAYLDIRPSGVRAHAAGFLHRFLECL